jgi:hypothetical protein
VRIARRSSVARQRIRRRAVSAARWFAAVDIAGDRAPRDVAIGLNDQQRFERLVITPELDFLAGPTVNPRPQERRAE